MNVDIIYLILVITVVKGENLETDSISISEHSVSWGEAIGSRHTLLSSDFVISHGWNSIPKNLNGSRYWIGARAKHTPFVSWEGCGQWIEGHGCGNLLPGGSIGDCLRNCAENNHFFLLKESYCRCVPKNNRNCFNYTHARCNRPCPNNPNDWCGGSDEAMSLYYTGPYTSNDNFETNNGSEDNCVVRKEQSRTISNDSTLFQSKNCRTEYTRRYICKNESSALSVTEDNNLHFGWLEAHEQCRVKRRRLHYDISNKTIEGSLFWTSIRRSILLKWTNKTDDTFPFCVSLSVDNSIVGLHEEPCDLDHHYLYLNEGHVWWRWWYPLFALPIAGLLVFAILCSVLLSRKSSKKSKSPGDPVQEGPVVTNKHCKITDEERSSDSAPHHVYNTCILEIVDSDGKTGSVYNTTIGRRAVGIAQNSSNVYDSVRDMDSDVDADTSTEIASANNTGAYDVVRW